MNYVNIVRKASEDQARRPEAPGETVGTLRSGKRSSSWMSVHIPALYITETRSLSFTSRMKVDAAHVLPLDTVRVIRKVQEKNRNTLEIIAEDEAPYHIDVAADKLDYWYKLLQKDRVDAMRLKEERLRAEDPYYDMRHKMKGARPQETTSELKPPTAQRRTSDGSIPESSSHINPTTRRNL